MKRILFFLLFLIVSISMSAQVIFTGGGDGNSWEDDLNWRRDGDPSLPGVPQSGDDILIDAFLVSYTNLSGNLDQFGTLELRNGANLFTQSDIYLSGDLIIDIQSSLDVTVQDVDVYKTIICDGNYFVNGAIHIAFLGFVPQIGDSFKIVDGAQGSCGMPNTDLSSGGGFDVSIGAECQFDGVYLTVTGINYTTAISWDGEGNDGLWINPANWDPNGIPPADSTVVLNLPGSGAYITTGGAGTLDLHTIYIGRDNTLILNSDLLMNKYIYLSKDGTLQWQAGKIYSKDANEQSAIIKRGNLTLDGPGLKELDTNFYLWSYSGDINHNQGNLNINNGIIRMYGDYNYNINGDNINIGYASGTLHELSVSVVSAIKKTTGNGTSSINLTTLTNYGKIISESGTLAINGNLTTGTFQDYKGTYGGSGSIEFPNGFVVDGVISPGSSPGILTVVGNLATSSSAEFDIEIDGPNAGLQYDQILVTGNATLNGTINVTLGYLPSSTASFAILSASNIANCNFPAQVTANYNGTNYVFNVICSNNTLYLNGIDAELSVPRIDKNELKIYPNPVNDLLTIKSPTQAKGSWSIYNQLGQQVLYGIIDGIETKISVDSLAKGIYLLQVKDENNVSINIRKVIVSN
ncbi:MAG: T9SS type A sorting domain-containing protein [Flavobacteriaceae bacterium]